MEQNTKKQKMSIYFPLELLEQVRASAKKHKRSLNQEVLFILDREVNKEVYDRQLSEAADRAIREQEFAMLTDLVEATPEEFAERRKKYSYLGKRITQEELREQLDRLKGLGHSPQE